MAGSKLNINRGDDNPEVAKENYPQKEEKVIVHNGVILKSDSAFDAEGMELVTNMDRAELDAFMEEKVVIRLAKVKDAKPEDIVSPCVNGRYQHLFRGVPQVVARKFVEALFRSHETAYAYEGDGDRAIMEGELPQPSSSPSHPFEIMQDTPKGREWFNRLVNGQI